MTKVKILVLAVEGDLKGHCHEKGIKKGVKSTYTGAGTGEIFLKTLYVILYLT